MPDWENLRHLAALVRGGSLSAAARLLGVEHATVARRIASLEAELGVRAVDRRGRKLMLTTEGARLAEIAERMEQEAMAAERLAKSGQRITGTVTISAPPAFATHLLVAPLVRLQALHADLTIHLLGEARMASLERREADLAIRLDRPQKGDLSSVRLCTIDFRAYASPGYLAATAPKDWTFVGYGDELMRNSPQERQLRTLAAGRRVAMLANTVELQAASVRAGAGIAILPEFAAENDPTIVVVDNAAQPLTREVWLIVHTDLRSAPAVRAVIDTLKTHFGRI